LKFKNVIEITYYCDARGARVSKREIVHQRPVLCAYANKRFLKALKLCFAQCMALISDYTESRFHSV
jgi:hypothetical protein